MTTTIAYIDGFNLYHGLRQRFRHRYLWLDLAQLVHKLRPNDTVVKIRYFTAAVRNDPPAQSRQQAYLSALTAHCGPALEVVSGRYQARSVTCRICGATWTSYEEKETDVNIAVSLVADAATAAADLAVIISADSDLCPAIRTARTIANGLGNRFGIIAAFPPQRYSHEIKNLIPGAFTIAHADIRNSLLPNIVTDPRTARQYHCPQKWH